jgi:hypothetical protein
MKAGGKVRKYIGGSQKPIELIAFTGKGGS